jgi:hypothetical protein
LTNIINAFVRVRAGRTALAIFFTLTSAAVGSAMKSDPDNYYLDPEEARYYATDLIIKKLTVHEGFVDPYILEAKLTERDIRLLAGRIPLYDIDGGVAAYIYLAYFGRGPLPTIDEIVKKAREVSDDRKEVIRNEKTHGFSLYDFDEQNFPYANLCASALIGISKECDKRDGWHGLPYIITHQKEAEDAACVYFGTSGFELVKYLFLTTSVYGYEFTDGSKNIIVPLDLRSGRVHDYNILDREEIEADGGYEYTFDAERALRWVELKKRRFTEHGTE